MVTSEKGGSGEGQKGIKRYKLIYKISYKDILYNTGSRATILK